MYETVLNPSQDNVATLHASNKVSHEPECARFHRILTMLTCWFNTHNTMHLPGFVIATMWHFNWVDETG